MISQPPPLPRRRRLHPFWIAIGALLLAGGMAVAVFYLEENWRGARAWAACRRGLEAKGENLAWRDHIPPPVPDDQNLALAQVFVRELRYQTDPKSRALTFSPSIDRPVGFYGMPYGGARPQDLQPSGWDLAKPTDLSGRARAYRQKTGFPHTAQPQAPADEVLLALTRYTPVLDELARAAAQRPLTRFPVRWDNENPSMTALPQYYVDLQIVGTLRLRASASVAAGRTDDALRDLELCWRFCGDMRRDPVLLAHLEEITCLSVALTPVWEGLADRRWTREQLVRLQADLQRFDLLADYVFAFRGERTFGLLGIDFLANGRDLPQFLQTVSGPGKASETNSLGRGAFAAVPRGWFDLNKASFAQHMQTDFIEAVDPGAHRFYREKFEADNHARQAKDLSFTHILARLALPVFGTVSHRTIRLQTGLDEAVTACALERFFLDHQAYPSQLDELVPSYLEHVPTDVMDGRPLRYRTTPDGRYQLYSIGWNARDDGGTVAWNSFRSIKDTEGDWVWQYAALNPPPPGSDR